MVLALLLVAATILVYVPALRGGFVWDDDRNITQNPTLEGAAGLWRIWTDPFANQQYYPLTHTSFWIERRLWGAGPFGYHLDNVLLHAGVALLLWTVLRRLSAPGALFAAALFALHPLQVESVAWITERKNLLSGLLALGSLWIWMRYAKIGEDQPASVEPDRRWYLAAIILFAAALLAKTAVAPLPVVMLVLLWWKRKPRSRAFEVAPFFGLAVAAGLTTAWLERHHVGALGEAWSLTWPERVILSGRAAWFYAAKTLWPTDLIFIYPRFDLDAGRPLLYLFPLTALALPVALFTLRRRFGMGPLAAVLIYAAAVGPALGMFDLYFFRYTFVQDHFQYFGSMALLALGAAAANMFFQRVVKTRWSAVPVWVPALAVLAVLGSLSWSRAHVFQDSEALYRDTLARNPAAAMAHNNLGNLLMQRGQNEEALRLLREGIAVNPGDWEGYYNVGLVLNLLNRPDEAEASFVRTLDLVPRYWKARIQLAMIHEKRGDFASAATHYVAALQIEPDNPMILTSYSRVLFLLGRAADALDALNRALALDPTYALAHYRRGLILQQTGFNDDARSAFQRAAALDPSFAALANDALGKQP